jgi:DNA-binding Xre family transcriptional regulator
MTIHRVTRRTDRTPAEAARLRADRERYQRDKPTVDQLLAEGGHTDTVPLGEFIALHEMMFELKRERERQGLTLADLADRTGIDPAALSRLETGKQANPTFDTLCRIAHALQKAVVCGLRDLPASA